MSLGHLQHVGALCPPACPPHGYECPQTYRVPWLNGHASMKLPSCYGNGIVLAVLWRISGTSVIYSNSIDTIRESNHMYLCRRQQHVGAL